MNPRLLLRIGLILFVPILLQGQATPQLNDSVSILKLDQPLSSRSQLGGLVVDRLGYIYCANFHDSVWRISPSGKVRLLSDGLYGSSGIAIDRQGNVYQANFFGHSIIKIDRFGNISTFLEEGINGPVGMIFDEAQNLYVCNFNENNILKITPNKSISVFANGPLFNGPNGITIDPEGNLYVVNFNNNQVVKINTEAVVSNFSEIPGIDGNAHIVAYQDNLYISKIKSNQVFQLNSNGEHKLIGGTGVPKVTEGAALTASFARPNGIGVDAQTGALYVNNLIGNWTSQEATTISISKISLLTIRKILSHHMDNANIEEAKKAFWQYHKDPFHKEENLGPTLGSLGWQYMARRNVRAAIALFELQAEAYPDRWRGYFSLGEVYKIIGQNEQAKKYYLQALKLEPSSTIIQAKLKELDGK